ncbi:MAG: para-aminobenzoate synthetase component I [Gallionellaceae bacterium]|nr:MAG: para-aminobenzoate synthetase component I [Gallionellaceae bacterium]
MLYSSPLPYLSDSSAYFEAVRDLPWAAWLDSGGRDRFDIIVAQPVATLTTRGQASEIKEGGQTSESFADPIALLQDILGQKLDAIPELPFSGGALGYWSYDLGRRYHQVSNLMSSNQEVPEMAVGIFDWAIVVNHQQANARLVSRLRYPETEQKLAQISARIAAAVVRSPQQQTTFSVTGEIRADLNRDDYRSAFDKVKAYLKEGDCYQVNLAQRFSAQATGDTFEAYRAMRISNPAPYSAYLEYPELNILCASPERFLKVQQDKVETKPIKGTRPRSDDVDEDRRLSDELRNHSKDRAENLMIVDLLRNDLSRSCEVGSVKAPKLFEVESFANVHHLVSTVEGRLANGHDALDVLRDCFPGGSITGAPKLRAMQIIEELESQRRGVYCGAIGYVGFDGNMDTNIAIRTLTLKDGELSCWAGGGIVADSECEAEYQETLDKASAMLKLMERFGGSAF